MSKLNVLAALPETVILAAACLVLVADLYVPERRRNLSYSMSLTALAAAALCCWNLLQAQLVQYAFGGMFVTDPMAQVLKLFALLATGFALVYAQSYARARAMWRGELFSLALFTLLGVMTMISANNLLVIYLGLELQSLALYALVALQRDQPRAGEAAMKYFVLGALASGFLLYGMSMLYGATGTLDINEIAHRISALQVANRPALVLATVFLVAGIGFKLGAAPFHVGHPHVKRRRAQLETDPCHQEYRRQHERRPVGHLQGRDPVGDFVDVQSTGGAIQHRHPVQQESGRQGPQHEVLHRRFPGSRLVALQRDQRIQGERLQLQPEVDHQQVVGRNHRQHAQQREQREREQFSAPHRPGARVALRIHQRKARRQQGEQLQHLGHRVGHEHAAERVLHELRLQQVPATQRRRGQRRQRHRITQVAPPLRHVQVRHQHQAGRRQYHRLG